MAAQTAQTETGIRASSTSVPNIDLAHTLRHGVQSGGERSDSEWHIGAGVRLFSTIGTSAMIEITRAWDNGRGNTRGWTATGELGSGGSEFFIGHRHAGNLWNAVALGAAYVSTGDEARGVAAHQAFVGPEFRITLVGVGIALGHYWRVDGDAPNDSRFFDVSFLIGIW